ncbi:hypothetical protein HD806DRAFT_526904 [Xylariaceae sp. AK1471]|nr:hypothetical protein HD806DRAFT_526904 [Xylariaceae sp. AK1471]
MSTVDPQRVLSQGYPNPTDNGLITLIGEWVRLNRDAIVDTYWQAAGYEIWAQVQLTKYINNCLGNRYAIRSGTIYKNNERSDIVVRDRPATINNANDTLTINGSIINGIELKCRGFNTTKADFRADIVGDYRKVINNRLAHNISGKGASTNENFRQADWRVWQINSTAFTIYYRTSLL